MADRVLSTSEVARVLECSESHVRALSEDGRLPASRTGSGIRIFSSSDVQRVAQERAREREGK